MGVDRQLLRSKLDRMATALSASAHLGRIGALFSETVLIDVEGAEFYLAFEKGRLVSIAEGPSLKTPWRFGLRVKHDALRKFWEEVPRPGYHDIFGLVKYGHARIDGDILVLVKNLRFFKEFMAFGRVGEVP
ncbi:MAG TPA: hypothetical protein VEF07_11425 [Candidatus Binataceae bacterium]|nr:hypothetical protein [Candidatus Binataceae bacterium]